MIKNRNRSIERLIFRSIPVYEIDQIRQDLDLDQLIRLIEDRIDQRLFKNIESIFIVSSGKMKNRHVSSVFLDGSIYISTMIEDPMIKEEQMIKDIIHELGHSFEGTNGDTLFGDQLLEEEFIGKRLQIHNLLESEGYKNIPTELIYNTEYDKNLDRFYHSVVGYEDLNILVNGVFTSAYSITSLSEYFANGFEENFVGDQLYLKRICPVLFNKIKTLSREIMK